MKINTFDSIHNYVLISIVNRELYHNNIVRIQSNTFDGLPALQYLRIDRNAINCDCSILDVVNTFNHNRTRVHIICDTPPQLHGQSLNSVNAKDFHCGKENDTKLV